MNHVSHEGSSSPVQLQEGTNGDMEFILHNKRTDSSKSAWHAVINAWCSTVTRDGYGPLSDIEILPRPYLRSTHLADTLFLRNLISDIALMAICFTATFLRNEPDTTLDL